MEQIIKFKQNEFSYRKVFIFFFSFLLFLFNLSLGFSLYISEIKFNEEEYIEIYSNKFLDLNDAFIYDDNLYEKYNTVSLIKNKSNSNFTLIVGSNFLQKYDINNLNCSVYLTSSTQVSKGGLKNNGERVLIEYDNNNSFFLYEHNNSFIFNSNESLHFYKNGSFIIQNNSPCSFNNIYDFSNESNNTNNIFNNTSNSSYFNNNISSINDTQNFSLNNQSENKDTFFCDFDFDIILNKEIFNESIDFSFISNLSSGFIIEYYIEDYFGNIVKNKFNSSSKNKKIFTPKKKTPEIYFIKANIYFNNCSIKTISDFVFYYPTYINQSALNESLSCVVDSSYNIETYDDNFITNIEILNKDELLNYNTNILNYKISRGSTRFRVVKFFLNNEEIFSITPPIRNIVEGSLFLNINFSKDNTILIKGLDMEKEIFIKKKEKIIEDKNSFISSTSYGYSSSNNHHDDNVNINNLNNITNNNINESYNDFSLNLNNNVIYNSSFFYYNISFIGLDLNNNKLYFNLTYPKNFNFSHNCKILDNRKVLTQVNSDLNFGINKLLYKEKINNESFISSKINCRIDPTWRVTPLYFDLELSFIYNQLENYLVNDSFFSQYFLDNKFNLSLQEMNLTNQTYENISINFSDFNESSSNISFEYLNSNNLNDVYNNNLNKNSSYKDNSSFFNFKSNILDEENIDYSSNQNYFKKNSFIGIFLGSVFFLILIFLYSKRLIVS